MKCSFCEAPLVCKSCKRPVRPRHGETHIAVYQPDMQVSCPECQKVLVCQACGFVYGEQEDCTLRDFLTLERRKPPRK